MKLKLTIEESARLINEFGISKELADIVSANEPYYPDDVEFSLGVLLSILPKKITDRQRIYELRVWVDHYSDNWCIEYTHDIDVNDFEDSFVSAEELIDAVYKEICFLKTEKIQEL